MPTDPITPREVIAEKMRIFGGPTSRAHDNAEIQADRIIEALAAAGYRIAGPDEAIVPREPTERMLGLACGYTDFTLPREIGETPDNHRKEMAIAYRAMIRAAEGRP